MIAVKQARHYLEQLGLEQAAEVLEDCLERVAEKDTPHADFLADLLGVEAARRARYLKTRTRLADLPFVRTLDQLDFSFQRLVDEQQVRWLAALSFVPERRRR